MKTLVLGASLKEERYSFKAILMLSEYGYDVVAHGLREGNIGNVSILKDLIPYTDIDTVTLYLNPKRQEGFYDYIISLSPRRVIFNPGTENPELYRLLHDNGIAFEESCTLVLLRTNQY